MRATIERMEDRIRQMEDCNWNLAKKMEVARQEMEVACQEMDNDIQQMMELTQIPLILGTCSKCLYQKLMGNFHWVAHGGRYEHVVAQITSNSGKFLKINMPSKSLIEEWANEVCLSSLVIFLTPGLNV
jgi:hypothetical protein